MQAAALQISPAQRELLFLPLWGFPPEFHAYRRRRATAWESYEGCRMVGLALVQDLRKRLLAIICLSSD